MAGSYSHCVEDDGSLIKPEDFPNMIENLGDAYEAIEEMYWMIHYLAAGDSARIWEANKAFYAGKRLPPQRSALQEKP